MSPIIHMILIYSSGIRGIVRRGSPATFHKSQENYLTVSAGPLIIRAVHVAAENYQLLTGFECKSCFRE